MFKPNNQLGFSPVIIIVIIAAVLVIGVIGWRVWDAGQITNNSTTQSTTTSPQPQTNPNQGYVVIKEWGVRFKPVDGLVGVEYFRPSGIASDNEMFGFTTKALGEANPNCGSNSSSTVIMALRRTTSQSDPGQPFGPIGNYYFHAQSGQAACGTDPATDDLQTKIKQLLSQSFQSLEASK